jgi:hypothetical protein
MRSSVRGLSILGSAVLVAALSCGTHVDLGATTRAEDLPGGASNDSAAGSGGDGGFGGAEGSAGSTDAAADADSGSQPDGLSPSCPVFNPAWEMTPVACEAVLPLPWADSPLPNIFLGLIFLSVNVFYRSPLGEERVIGYVDSAADCAGVVEGWYLVDPRDPRLIVLCPETCSALENDGGRLFTSFGCPRVRAEPR